MIAWKSVILLFILIDTIFGQWLYPCRSVNIFFTGLPHDHPAGAPPPGTPGAEGVTPAIILRTLKEDARLIVAAGYNLKVVFLGPEVGIPTLESFYPGTRWTVAVTGFGVRRSPDPTETYWFTDIQNSFRRRLSHATLLYNYSANSTLAILQKQYPLPPDCPPGRDYGYTEVCAREVCPDGGDTSAA